MLLSEKTKVQLTSNPRIRFSAKPQGSGEMVTEWEEVGFIGDRKKGGGDLRPTTLMLRGLGLLPSLLGCKDFDITGSLETPFSSFALCQTNLAL